MKFIENTPLSAVDLQHLHDQGISFFTNKWNIGAENERYKKGKHWSEDQEKKIASQDRQPYSMAAISTKLGIIAATQQQARTMFRVEAAVDPSDEVKAELASLMLRDVERRSKFKYIESDVFNSGKDVIYGAAEVYLDYSNLEPETRVRKLDYRDVVWDSNNKAYDIDEDGLFIAKIDRVHRYELESEYGDIINEVAENDEDWGRSKDSYYISPNKNGVAQFDIISKITHYQKVIRKQYYVTHPDSKKLLGLNSQVVDKFNSKKEADRKLRELNIPYIVNGLDIEGSVEDHDEVGYDKYVFADRKILEYEKTDLPSFPIKVFKCFTFENDFWSFMDMLKSPQIFMDRLFSQIDYTFGTDIKNVYQLNTNALSENETPESAMLKARKTGGVIQTNSNELAIQSVPSKGINPQWLQVANIMQGFVEDFAGGRSFQGLGEGSGESGKAINMKKQQGTLVAALMLDNLSRWKQSVGELILWFEQEFDTVERQIKVQGDELSPEMMQLLQQNGIFTPSQVNPDTGFVNVNRGGIPFLKDADFELVVTEASLTNTEKEYKFFSMLEAGRSIPILQGSTKYAMLLLRYNPDITSKDRNELLKDLEAQQKAQAEAAKKESDREDAKVQQGSAKIMADMKNNQMKINLDALKISTDNRAN